jgi:dipeptidyl aminopeptidase/acylaminoacyl peptidase
MEIRVREITSGEETVPVRLTGPTIFVRQRLSPDGGLLAWEEVTEGKYVVLVGRTGEPGGQEQCRECQVLGFTSDGRRVLLSTDARGVVLREVAGGTETTVLPPPAEGLIDADLSWDDRWLATLVASPDRTVSIRVVLAASPTSDKARGVEIARSGVWLSSPRWSPDGRRLYYMAVEDGFLCIWARDLDPVTKAPRGEPFAVFHAHRNPWRTTSPRAAFTISVGPRRLVFNAASVTGSVLMAQLPPE